jgi:hypothetical protein
VRDDRRRARIMAAVTEHGTAAGAGKRVQRLCRFAVEEMARSAVNANLWPSFAAAALAVAVQAGFSLPSTVAQYASGWPDLPELLATPRASALAGARCTMFPRTWLDGRCGFDE